MKNKFVFLTTVLILLLNCVPLFAQEDNPKFFTAQSSASGEETIVHLERILNDFRNSNERLFVIVHLGRNESLRSNDIRIFNTRMKLFMMKFDAERLLFAEGEKVKDEGRIEFYLGSELRLVVLARRNQMPNLTCCPDYFPPVKRKRKKLKNE